MAKGSVPVKQFKKGGPGRKANPELAAEKAKGKPVVIFLPKVLHSRVRLACIALGTNTSTVARELFDGWVRTKSKAIAAIVNMTDTEEEDVEEAEEEDVEETEDEDEDDE